MMLHAGSIKKEREVVSKELKANIYDMLQDDKDKSEVRTVLYKMSLPSLLVEKYRQNPRYLILPSIYDEYVDTAKWIVPLVGFIIMFIVVITNLINMEIILYLINIPYSINEKFLVFYKTLNITQLQKVIEL